jgi:predicted Zn-dependent protease
MIKKWTQILRDIGFTRWKLLFFHRIEVGQVWQDGDAQPVLNQEQWICRVKIYEDFFQNRCKWTAEQSVELDSNMAPTEIKAILEKEAKNLRKNSWPWFPMHQGPTAPGLTQESSLAKKPDMASWLEPLARAFYEGSNKMGTLQLSVISLETLYLDSLGREMDHKGHWLQLHARHGAHSLKIKHGEFVPDRIRLKASRFYEESQLLAQPAVWEGDFPNNILLGGELPGLMFSYVLRQLDGSSLYAGDSPHVVGMPLYANLGGDTITLKPLVKLYNSPYSRWFDEEGVMLKEVELVRDGMVKAFTASQREAHLLGLPVTGHFVNFSVGPGSLSNEELRQTPYLEINDLDNFQVDEASGEFSATIPVAFGSPKSGQPRRAYVGLKLQGNLRELLARSRWSTAVAQKLNFEGPEFISIPKSFLQLTN